MRIEGHNWLLLVVVGLSAAAHFGLRAPVQSAAATPALFADFDPGEVRRVEIEQPLDGEEVALLELQRDERGWILPQLGGARAYGWSVDALLSGLRGVRDADRVSERSESWALYGVGAAGVRVRVVGSGGVALVSFVQWRALTQDGSASLGTFLRPRGGVESGEEATDGVYRAGGLAPLSAQPGDWLDTRVFPVAAELVRELELVGPDGTLERLLKTGDEWGVDVGGPEPVELRSPVAGALVGELVAMHFLEPLTETAAEPTALWRLRAVADGATEFVVAEQIDADRLLLRDDGTGSQAVLISEAWARELMRACERLQTAAQRARER